MARLSEHTGTGRLTLAEFEERVSAVYAARTLADLDRLMADLPAPPRAVATKSGPPAAVHLAPIIFTGLICLLIWALTSVGSGRPLYFWPMWVVGPWAAAMVFGGLFGHRRVTR